MKKRILSAILTAALMASLTVQALAAAPQFTDVPQNQWYYTWVTKAAQAGWVSGVGNNKFDPHGKVTYSQFAVMLDKALYPDDLAAQPKGAYWWTPACEVADRHGLFADTGMASRSNWTDVANKPMEREEMAQMMYNALTDLDAKLPTYEEYTEVAMGIGDIIDTDNYDAVATCYAIKLLTGTGNGNFDPHSPMTRAQAAVVLCNIYGYVTGDPEVNQPTTPTETRGIVGVTCTKVPETASAKVLDVITIIKTSGFQAGTKLSIAPTEDYPSVLMPDDNTAVIEGTGDATFEKICFTAPGTYSFRIYEEEGMEHYRYDAREWELTVTVTGTAGAPTGAVGGQYDVSAFDVPADANKDGWITEAEVQAVLAQLRIDYPDGSPWGSGDQWWSPVLGGGAECAGFAYMVSDKIFGTLPKYEVAMENTRIGDVLDDGPAHHTNVILNDYGKAVYEGEIYAESYYTVDGNVAGEVLWDNVDEYANWPTGTRNTVIYSRYPQG